MAKPRRFFWLLFVLVVAAVLLILFLRRAPQPAQAFHAILNLTPGDLQSRCGSPAQDTTGVVIEGAGIRDLHYSDSGGADLVFRFISVNGQDWQSLGAWQYVNAPDNLGSPVAAPEAADRLRCVMKNASQAALAPFHSARPSSLAAALAVILRPQVESGPAGPEAPAMPAVPPPAPAMPNIPSAPSLPSLNAPSPDLAPSVGGSYPGSGPEDGPEGGPEGGPGGGPEESSSPPLIVACPPGVASSNFDSCEMLDYTAFLALLNRAVSYGDQNDFSSALDALPQNAALVANLPASDDGRDDAIKTILQLEVRAINQAEEQLHDDLAKLEPSASDSSDTAAQKLQTVLKDDQERRDLWKQAVEANRQSASVSGATMRFDSQAWRQLVQIHVTGNWP